MGLSKKMLLAAKKVLIQIISLVAVAMALYSASVEDRETVPYFFVFQAMAEPPRVIKDPVSERLVNGQAP